MIGRVPFNRPFVLGPELDNIRKAIEAGHLSGDGGFTKLCNGWLAERTNAASALLTHSCTAALEMAALLSGVGDGDEVIMPSFTFVSTANAFVLRGARPVFVDIRSDTLNIDATQIERAITRRTRAIVPVHYAGVACEMDEITRIAREHELLVIEDAAQGLLATYKGRPLGCIGDMGALSFHETKNIVSGEGGALLLRDAAYTPRAEIIREKGTNRSAFFRGEVDKYTWVDVGSSYLPSEIVAAFLWAQLQYAEELTNRRLQIWNQYHDAFAELEGDAIVRRPIVPPECRHNGHIYYLLVENLDTRQRILDDLRATGIGAIFHYVPLHSAPAGLSHGRMAGPLPVTEDLSNRLIRLPMWPGLEDQVERVIELVKRSVVRRSSARPVSPFEHATGGVLPVRRILA